MKNLRSIFLLLFVSAITFTACEEDDSVQPSAPAANNGGATQTDTTQADTTGKPMGDQFWLGSGTVKCTPYTKNFTRVIGLLSINTEKCYQEFGRPNFTFNFYNSSFGAGTYNIVPSGTSSTATDVVFSMFGYNGKTYSGVSGNVTVTKSTIDSTKLVLEWDKINLYSITDSSNHTFTGRIENF